MKLGDFSPYYGGPELPSESTVPSQPKQFERYKPTPKDLQSEPSKYKIEARIPPKQEPLAKAVLLSDEQKRLLQRLWHKMIQDNSGANPDIQFIVQKLGTQKKWKSLLQQFDEVEFGNQKDAKTFSVCCDLEAGNLSLQPAAAKGEYDGESAVLAKILRDTFEVLKKNYIGYISTTMQLHDSKGSTVSRTANQQIALHSLEAERLEYKTFLLQSFGSSEIAEIDQQIPGRNANLK
jgi:hypothetical protein